MMACLRSLPPQFSEVAIWLMVEGTDGTVDRFEEGFLVTFAFFDGQRGSNPLEFVIRSSGMRQWLHS
jgi:hypothetical protein